MARARAVREFHGADAGNSPRRLAALRRELLETADAIDRAADLLGAFLSTTAPDPDKPPCRDVDCPRWKTANKHAGLITAARVCRNLADLIAAIEDPAAYLAATEDDE
jgi:hypothetical protein